MNYTQEREIEIVISHRSKTVPPLDKIICAKCGCDCVNSKRAHYYILKPIVNTYYGAICKDCLGAYLSITDAPREARAKILALGKGGYMSQLHPLKTLLTMRADRIKQNDNIL